MGNKNGIKKHKLPEDFYAEIITPIINTWNQKLIINSKSTAIYYSFEKGKFSKFKLNNSIDFTQNTAITDDAIWICTPNGMHKIDLLSNQNKTYFTDQNISYILKDKHNNYWISTLNKGVLFIQDFSNNFIDLQPRPNSLSLGKNEVFIGAEKDLIYKLNCKNLQTEIIYESKSNHSISQIFADTINEKVFFNSFKFNILNKNNQITNEFSIAIKDIKKVDKKYFSFAASGILGIFCVDKNLKSSWDTIFEKNKKEDFSGFNQALLLNNTNGKSTEYNAINNTIYYATNNGLIAITNDGKTQELKHKNETLFLVKIQKYKDNIIGLSTAEKLYSINAENVVTRFKLPEFIAKEKFNRFFIRNQYCYLFSTNSVYEYDFETQNIQKVISLSNDIEATDVILKNNQLFFATSKGIVIKNRNEIGNFPKPKLIINEIQINGKRREVNQLKELNPDENDIAINFSTLAFVPNESYSVSYKINNSEWKTLDLNDKNLKLYSLASGNYTIQLAINHDNLKIDLQTIQFEIKKPFWLKPIFLFGFGFVFLGLIYTFYKLQILKLEKRNQLLLEKVNLEKNLNQSKLKAIKSQMNPHFFYNALNTIQSFILSNEKKQAVSYLSKFSNLTRTILEMTEKETISIAEEVKTLGLYLDIEKARFEEDFNYHILVDDEIDAENIKIPTMLLQPYVENAVKHGLLHKQGEKAVTIHFQKETEHIKISIDDNGIGRQKSTELNAIKNKNHNSFATEAMQNRVNLLNQYNQKNISIQYIDKTNLNNQPTGTSVVFEIPITY
ncbi:histidine kinase [Flavobacterium sp. HXWNR29]|uniref:sensor histidine kinase n=1 Tax=Flavobacterium odoriferum TaxID=2946604 RepID=UPI0021CAFCC1|nr:histidine kinase [Flavobacterium sp. HXWNR29]MCU4189023.1 histidine kinase [Flavobacterium sp. HXWNR29]